MTTFFAPEQLHLISSNAPQDLWSHPTLDLFTSPDRELAPQKALLYSSPSLFGESFDDDDRPQPTSASELPDIRQWVMSFTVNLLEIYAGRRQPAQLAARCHRVIFLQLLAQAGRAKEIGRIRKIHQDQPLDGICESVVTIAYRDRLRSLVIRCEGLDGRWLCTALRLL